MRSSFSSLLLVISVAAWVPLAAHGQVPSPAPEPPPPAAPTATITVSATGEVKVAPDEAYLHLGIEARDLSLDEAKRQHDTRLASVMKLLADNGVQSKDVSTDYLQIQPEYRYDDSQIRPSYYTATRTLSVRLTALDKFDALLTSLLKNGVQRIQGVEFRSTKIAQLQEEAWRQAAANARKKAEQLAAALGAHVGRPLEVSDGAAAATPLASRFRVEMAAAQAPAPHVPSEFAIGQIVVNATVQVTFGME